MLKCCYFLVFLLMACYNLSINKNEMGVFVAYYRPNEGNGMEQKLGGELKIMGDPYAGGFSCGMTMGGNGTMERMELVSQDEHGLVYSTEDGVCLTVGYENRNGVWDIWTQAYNGSLQPVTLEMLTSFLLRDMRVDRIYRMQSCWSAEGKLKIESVTDLHLEKSWNGCAYRIEKFGNVGSMPVRKYFPFLVVEDCEKGCFTGVQLYCASSWQMELRCKEKDTFTISGGLADRDFGQWTKTLQPKESFAAPKAVIAQGKSLLEVCDKLVKAQRPETSPMDSSMGILFNEYCTTWGNPTFENVKRVCDKIADKGIDFLVIDSGWYGNAENWWDMVGDWFVNEKRFPGGMKGIADYIRSKGMIPGLWFEMECVNSGAENYKQTDHLVQKDGYPLTVGNRRFWDMEDPWAVEYLTKTVIGILKEAGFGYLKVDYNDSMGMGCDGPEGPGENLRRKVQHSRAFFQKIRQEIPGIVIENCSSGGHRLEPSMMELVSQASFSDAHETPAIPLIAANMHRVIQPGQSQIWAVMRAGDSAERIYYSMAATFLGRMCLSGDIYDLSESQWQLIEEGMAFYKQVADIIRDGCTTVICTDSKSYNQPTGSQLVVRMLGDKGLAVFHRFENSRDVEDVVLHLLREQMPETSVQNRRQMPEILSEYGCADKDFSAKAWYFRYNEMIEA